MAKEIRTLIDDGPTRNGAIGALIGDGPTRIGAIHERIDDGPTRGSAPTSLNSHL